MSKFMAQTIKDRVAVGDDCFRLEQLTDGRTKITPSPDSVTEEGTDLNKALLQPIVDSLEALSTNIDCGEFANFSLSQTSWEKINEISRLGLASECFKLGDEKNITLTTGEEITLVILGFNHDELSDGSGKAGITFGMKNLLATKYPMNLTDTNNGGWESSSMRLSTMATLLSYLPTELQSVIKRVNKKTAAGSELTTITTTADKLFLFAEVEIDNIRKSVYSKEGIQYEYWKSIKDGESLDNRIKYLANGREDAENWLIRSAGNSTVFKNSVRVINRSGGISNGDSTLAFGVCFGFCV